MGNASDKNGCSIWGLRIPKAIADHCVKVAMQRNVMAQDIAIEVLISGMEHGRLCAKSKPDHQKRMRR